MNNNLTLANKITLLRLFIVPAFAYCILYGLEGYALICFSSASIADGMDGFLARKRNEITSLGSLLDPIADKILMVTSFLLLSYLKYIPVWLSILVIGRDFILVFGYIILRIIINSNKIKPSFLGKTTTVLQMSTIIIVLLISFLSEVQSFESLQILFLATGILTIVSGIHYLLLVGLRLIKNNVVKI
ncbi:MAG: CDP-alcohol phosphatidyltransferase family protein [Nitrospinota bacterium]|nr:CDP-alcohol phosphatidyltransferase family protein [Nitrospinota bacterium]